MAPKKDGDAAERGKNLKYVPADENTPANKKAVTNIGEFYPNEIRGVSESQLAEAERLVSNGEFEWTDDDPNSDDLAEGILEAEANPAPTQAELNDKQAMANAQARAESGDPLAKAAPAEPAPAPARSRASKRSKK